MDTPNLQFAKIINCEQWKKKKKIGGQKVSTTYNGSLQYVVKLVCPQIYLIE